jgi:Fe(3+) dicitrate transport protein
VNRIPHCLHLALCLVLPAAAPAQEAVMTSIPEVRVVAEAESDETIQAPYLPPVQGTRIYSGKKTSVIDFDELPRITNNNYRQALTKTPGLYLSEETTPLLSIGYRGLDPSRVQYTQVLKDGIPIHADQFGYPEAYYTPPLDTVDRIEFLRGGAALLYGPQPGGALNFITHRPRQDRPFSFGTTNTFGSDNYYSNFSYVDGTSGRVGYYGYYNHRETDGFREANSEVSLDAGYLKLVLDANKSSRWIFTLDVYAEEHGEPGGLTFATGFVGGLQAVNYNENRNGTSRFFDVFELERYFASLAWEKDFSETTRMTITGWGGYYSRFSERQRGGGFGTRPNPAAPVSMTVEHQEFYTEGIEARIRHDYELWGGTHTIAGGIQAYHTFSPRQDRLRRTLADPVGEVRNDNEREIFYLPVFVENRFHWGPLSIVPGVRIENFWQGVTEHINEDKTAAATPLADEDEHDLVPLFGLGVSYEIASKIDLYGNVSQSYRPKIFTQAVPTGGTTDVPENLDESKAVQYEIGFRGTPEDWITWDISAFLLDFDDQISTIALPGGRSTLVNGGRAKHYGVEIAGELDLIELFDRRVVAPPAITSKEAEPTPAARTLGERFGSLSIYANATLLEAEFVQGPLDGKTPRFAPDHLIRAGVIYRLRDRCKLALLGTFVGESFADDANTQERFVPAYTVWDLTAEVKIYKEISLNAGINNLFDEDYYARIANTGIDPAPGRNYYGGFSVKF